MNLQSVSINTPPHRFEVRRSLPVFEQTGPYGFCNDKFVLTPLPGTEVANCRDLATGPAFTALMDRYAARHPGCNRKAVISLWSLFYFSLLVIAPTIYRLAHATRLPLHPENMRILIDPEKLLPVAFVLDDAGIEAEETTVVEDLHALLRDHVAGLIPGMAAAERVSPKLLWNNVAVYFSWVLGHLREHADAETAGMCREMLVEAPLWPDGERNPMHGMLRDGNRRICCLRYMIPSIGGCGATCPLPSVSGQAQS